MAAISPVIPTIGGPSLPDLAGSFTSLPLQLEINPLILLVLTMLAGIMVGAISVILVYHWRRFPFEHATFITAERVYLAGVIIMLAVAVLGIVIA